MNNSLPVDCVELVKAVMEGTADLSWRKPSEHPLPRCPIMAIVTNGGAIGDDLDLSGGYDARHKGAVGFYIPVCGRGVRLPELSFAPYTRLREEDIYVKWMRVKQWRYLSKEEGQDQWELLEEEIALCTN